MDRFGFDDLREALAGQSVDLVLTGPPGCGKGTQGDALRDAGLVLPVAMSGLLKKAAKAGVIDGEVLAEYMEAGDFASDDMVQAAVEHGFPLEYEGVVAIDGLPRTKLQLPVLKKIQQVRKRLLIVVAFTADTDTLISRQLERKGRADATLKAATKRLTDYGNETQPVVDELLQTYGGVEVSTGPKDIEKRELSRRLETALVQRLQLIRQLVPGTIPVVPSFVAAQ
jgi:adenylate kinase